MAWGTPPTFTDGNVLTGAQLTTLGNDLLALTTWNSYTPTLTQSGAVAKTVTYAKYISANKWVTVDVFLAVTGTGTGNNAITVTLPVTAATSTTLIIGSGCVDDASVATYPCLVQLASTTTVKFIPSDVQSVSQFIGQLPNFGLVSGDQVRFSCSYEAA